MKKWLCGGGAGGVGGGGGGGGGGGDNWASSSRKGGAENRYRDGKTVAIVLAMRKIHKHCVVPLAQ